MKNIILILMMIVIGVTGGEALAAQETHNHAVTIKVPSTLELESPMNHIDLNFQQKQQGSETEPVTIEYSVHSNGMKQGNGATAISAQLDGIFQGMDFQAAFGTFKRSRGNAILKRSRSGFVTIRNEETALAEKFNISGKGEIVHGSFPITYKAVANADLASGTYHQQLILTLTDV